METAVIIVGGRGERLRPLTDRIPKTLVKVAGKPILYWKIQWLKKFGIEHIVLGVAYRKEKIYEYMKKNRNFGLEVDFSEHTIDGGTAEGINLAIKRFVNDKSYLVMNGDDIVNAHLDRMIAKHNKRKPLITMGLSTLYCRSSIVEIKNDTIERFKYGGKIKGIYLSNGVYVFDKKMEKYLVPKGAIEDLVFTKLAAKKKMIPYIFSDDEYWYGTNTIKDIHEAEKEKEKWMAGY